MTDCKQLKKDALLAAQHNRFADALSIWHEFIDKDCATDLDYGNIGSCANRVKELAMAAMKEQNFTEALAMWDLYLHNDRGTAVDYGYAGRCANKGSCDETTLQLLTTALNLADQNTPPRAIGEWMAIAGQIAAKNDRWLVSYDLFQYATELFAETGWWHAHLGTAALKLDRLPEALFAFEKALETNPDHAGWRAQLEHAQMKLEKQRKAPNRA